MSSRVCQVRDIFGRLVFFELYSPVNIAGWKIQHFGWYLPGKMGIFYGELLVERRVRAYPGTPNNHLVGYQLDDGSPILRNFLNGFHITISIHFNMFFFCVPGCDI